MKGPGLRIDLDVRRMWRCAKCGRTARTAAHVVAQRCGCSDSSPWMTLQLPVKRAPFQPPVREPLPELEVAEDRPVTPALIAEATVIETIVVETTAVETTAVGSPADTSPPVEASPSALIQTTPVGESPVALPPAAAAESAASAPAAPAPVPKEPPPDEFGAGLGDVSSDPQP